MRFSPKREKSSQITGSSCSYLPSSIPGRSDLGAAGDELGLELSAGGAFAAADLAVEDDLDGVRAAEVEVVGEQGLEETRACRGASKTMVRETSVWAIDSSHP